MHLARHLLRLVRALSRDRTRLALENLVLRQQLNVPRRSVERPRLEDGDRAFWTMACEFLANWKEHLVIVKPDPILPTLVAVCVDRQRSVISNAATDRPKELSPCVLSDTRHHDQ